MSSFAGAHVNTKGEDQWTPLHWAAAHGNLETAKFLLEKGADTEVQDNAGRTPLMHACSEGHKDVASHLIEHGEQLQIFVGVMC